MLVGELATECGCKKTDRTGCKEKSRAGGATRLHVCRSWRFPHQSAARTASILFIFNLWLRRAGRSPPSSYPIYYFIKLICFSPRSPRARATALIIVCLNLLTSLTELVLYVPERETADPRRARRLRELYPFFKSVFFYVPLIFAPIIFVTFERSAHRQSLLSHLLSRHLCPASLSTLALALLLLLRPSPRCPASCSSTKN